MVTRIGISYCPRAVGSYSKIQRWWKTERCEDDVLWAIHKSHNILEEEWVVGPLNLHLILYSFTVVSGLQTVTSGGGRYLENHQKCVTPFMDSPLAMRRSLSWLTGREWLAHISSLAIGCGFWPQGTHSVPAWPYISEVSTNFAFCGQPSAFSLSSYEEHPCYTASLGVTPHPQIHDSKGQGELKPRILSVGIGCFQRGTEMDINDFETQRQHCTHLSRITYLSLRHGKRGNAAQKLHS